jgi:hypothetical protein
MFIGPLTGKVVPNVSIVLSPCPGIGDHHFQLCVHSIFMVDKMRDMQPKGMWKAVNPIQKEPVIDNGAFSGWEQSSGIKLFYYIVRTTCEPLGSLTFFNLLVRRACARDHNPQPWVDPSQARLTTGRRWLHRTFHVSVSPHKYNNWLQSSLSLRSN